MAVITPGTGATINATTIEGQLWQLIHLIQNAERLITDSTERFNSTKDDTFIMSGSFNIPATITYNSSTGVFTPSAAIYLPNTTFTAGNPLGTIKGATLAQYFVDVCNYCVVWQNNTSKNPKEATNVTLRLNHNTLLYEGEFKLPYTTVLGSNGSITETATEWLTT